MTSDSEQVNIEEDVKFARPINPFANVAVPEKIILCVDVCAEQYGFELKHLRQCVDLFMKLKTAIDKSHEFSLIALEANQARVIKKFSTARIISNSLNILQPITSEDNDKFNLSNLLNIINSQINDELKSYIYNPAHVVRTILLLGRPRDKFSFAKNINLEFFPFAFVDLLWITNNMSNVEFGDAVTEFYRNSNEIKRNYIFKAEPDQKEIQCCLAQLLSHPLQRIDQEQRTDYKIDKVDSTTNE